MKNEAIHENLRAQIGRLLAQESPGEDAIEGLIGTVEAMIGGSVLAEPVLAGGGPDAVGMLQLVLNNIPVRVFWKDRGGKFLGCNGCFASDMGLADPSEIVGKDDFDFSDDEVQVAGYRTDDEEVMRLGEARYKIRERQEVNGECRWLETNKVPLRNAVGEVIGILGTYENITRQVEREERLSGANAELARAARLKDQFLAGMSHELRTPLNSILGLSEALQEDIYGGLNDRQRSAVGRVEEGGRHLLALINDILDIAKFEAGEVALDLGPVGVRALCESSFSFVREQAAKKSIGLSWEVDDAVDFLFGDERRLKQTLINLLSNAVKFTGEGGEVDLRVRGSAGRDQIHFAVRDNGIGIAPDRRDELFRPFRQIDSSLARAYDGAGLGLSLVKHMAGLHGGTVEFESQPGVGSEFTVTIPWRMSFEQEVVRQVSAELAPPRRLAAREHHALVIEDCQQSAEQLGRYLEEMGYEVTIAESGEQGLAAAASKLPDLIVLDILLPGITGWTVLERLRANAKTATVPIVIVSVIDEQGNASDFKNTRYLVKPVARAGFVDCVRALGVRTEEVGAELPARVGQSGAAQGAAPVPQILLAEDNDENVTVFTEYLEANGLVVRVVSNGAEAVEAALADPQPDIVLMDVQMPVMDGLEAIRRIRADKRGKDLPIIALTAMAMPGDRERCIDAGATDYLAKPVSLKELLATTRSHLGLGERCGDRGAGIDSSDMLSR